MAHGKRSKHLVIAGAILVLLVVVIAIFALRGCKQTTAVETSETIGCITAVPSLEMRQSIAQALAKRREQTPQMREAASVNIPVYFHIITNKQGTEGNLTDQDVQKQIDALNAAFSGTAPGGTGANTPFRFYLAGTERTANDDWFYRMTYSAVPGAQETAAKAALNRGGRSALNIYTVQLSNRPFGWARFPWDLAAVDGVVIRYSTLPGGNTYSFNQGDTATHEVGHWLGLFHVYEGGCNNDGDSVTDTPFQAGPASGCPSSNSCSQPGADPVENFMNSTNDNCMFQFTPRQADRMDVAHLLYRT